MTSRGLPHFARGKVVKGFGRGSKELGIPTANLPVDSVNKLPPELETGVYFGWAKVDNGPVYKMVMSIGWNPFYKNKEKSMEIHIMHTFGRDFYGCMLSIIILGYIRPEKDFESVEKLIQTIRNDIEVSEKELEKPERMGVISVKCRKCRHLLFLHPEITLFNGHGDSYGNISVKYISCGTIQEDNLWFLQDNNVPEWISEVINNSNWTKGKVNCPNCQGRLGSFDFVSGTRCQCGSHVLPAIHIVKCKVDCRHQN